MGRFPFFLAGAPRGPKHQQDGRAHSPSRSSSQEAHVLPDGTPGQGQLLGRGRVLGRRRVES